MPCIQRVCCTISRSQRQREGRHCGHFLSPLESHKTAGVKIILRKMLKREASRLLLCSCGAIISHGTPSQGTQQETAKDLLTSSSLCRGFLRTRPRKVSRRNLSESDDIRKGTVNDLTRVVVSETLPNSNHRDRNVCDILPSKTPPGISCRCTSVPGNQCFRRDP